MWLSASHPADSWYVAPPAPLVPKLIAETLSFANADSLAATMRLAISLVRTLQIHPFEDANGRTARALFLALGVRAMGPKMPLLSFLSHFWSARGLQLIGTSIRIRDTGQWRPFLDFALSCFDRCLSSPHAQAPSLIE